jgi:hypothetical protein
MNTKIEPGIGGPIAQPAAAESNVCGGLKIRKTNYWVTLVIATKYKLLSHSLVSLVFFLY